MKCWVLTKQKVKVVSVDSVDEVGERKTKAREGENREKRKVILIRWVTSELREHY